MFACSCLSVRAFVKAFVFACTVSVCLCVCLCVSSYFRHSHHGRLFLVLKDFVCMHMYMSMGICTHRAYVCACCVCVCVFWQWTGEQG